MKLISKYKDYYDYLTGIYGIDEKLVLDRREQEQYILPSFGKVILYIADHIIEGLYMNHKFYYGNTLKPFTLTKNLKGNWLSKHWHRDYSKSFKVRIGSFEEWFYLEAIKDSNLTNTKENCPIILETVFGKTKYPKLETLGLPSFLPAKTTYQWLTEWLSNQITNKEKQIKELPDSLKIESKGFDNKYSFRPKLKHE
jgi:hypothetical protein